MDSSIRAHQGQKDSNPNVATFNMVEGNALNEKREKKLSRGIQTLPNLLKIVLGSVV